MYFLLQEERRFPRFRVRVEQVALPILLKPPSHPRLSLCPTPASVPAPSTLGACYASLYRLDSPLPQSFLLSTVSSVSDI